MDNRDVEVSILFTDESGEQSGHMVTLSSLHFVDSDMDGAWKPGAEYANIDYIDPNCPSGTLGVNKGPRVIRLLYNSAIGAVEFDWQNGDTIRCDPAGPVFRARIFGAFAEGVPGPLPITGFMCMLNSWIVS